MSSQSNDVLYSNRRKSAQKDAALRQPGSEHLGEIAREHILHNHHIAPDPIQLPMFLVDAYFSESEPPHQPTAGDILNEDARHQFPETGCLALLHQMSERETTGTFASPVTPNIDGELGDTSIAGARAIGGSGGIGDDVMLL